MASLIEQETTVAAARDENVVHIYTSNAVHLRRLRKDARATEVKGGLDWGEFTVPTGSFDPLKGFKRRTRPMTDDERAAASKRLAAARASRD